VGRPAADAEPAATGAAAQDTAGAVKGAVQEAVGQAQQKADEVLQQAQQTATQVAGQVQRKATSRLDEEKHKTVDGLQSVSAALRDTAQRLSGGEHTPVEQNLGQFADRAADEIQRIGDYLGARYVGQLLNEVEDFARREPALFIGGAFLLGLLGARFLKSSAPSSAAGGGKRSPGAGPSSGTMQWPENL